MNDHSGFRKRSLYRRNSADGTKNVCINLTLQDPILVRANVYEPPIPVNKNTKLYHSTATCAPGYHPKVVLWISKENQGRWGEVSSYMDSYHGKQCPQGITWHRVPMTGSKCDDHLEKHFWAYDLMDHLLYAQEWNKDKPKHLLQFDDQWAKTANTNRKPNTTGSSRVCVPLLSVFRYTVAQVDPATGRHVDIMDYIMTGDKMEDAPHVKAQWNLRELRNVMSAM